MRLLPLAPNLHHEAGSNTPWIVGMQQHLYGKITFFAKVITLGWCQPKRLLP